MLDVDAYALREKVCWEYWNSLTDKAKMIVVNTVESEMQRLASTVMNWVPAATRLTNGRLEILITLSVDDLGVVPELWPWEEDAAERAIEVMAARVESWKDGDD